MRILLVEDDKSVSTYIYKNLKDIGHQVDVADNGKDGLVLAESKIYDVLVVDRMLPEIDGLTMIKMLRQAGKKIPVMILSALADVDDRVQGLRAGSDDYLVKPFAFSELMARIEVLGRRVSLNSSDGITQPSAGDLVIDLLSRRALRSGKEIELQSREFKLLEYMLRHKGHMITRAMLLEHVWDYNFDPQTNIIDVHVSRLRAKIDKGFDKPIIKTIRGVGYCIENGI